MDYQKIINKIHQSINPFLGIGKPANYIAPLSNVDPKKFGISLMTCKGEVFKIGDSEEKFSIQSISKVFALTIALRKYGSKIWTRVGREPSGSSFNSLIQLEYDNGIPRNPFINAGAIVISDILLDSMKKPKQEFLDFLRNICDNPNIDYNYEIAQAEKETGFRNIAMANFMKSYNNIHNDIDEVLDFYFHQCSIMMSCKDLCRAFLYLSNYGIDPINKNIIITKRQAKKINSLMLTCGLYNEVGNFAYRVGLPGKSGVGGGIIAVLPNELVISVWSPLLNANGNSFAGIKALDLFTTMTGKSIF